MAMVNLPFGRRRKWYINDVYEKYSFNIRISFIFILEYYHMSKKLAPYQHNLTPFQKNRNIFICLTKICFKQLAKLFISEYGF